MSAQALFAQALQAHGLLPGRVVADGRLRRCATRDKPRGRNGAYVLHPQGYGFFMNWALDAGMHHWRGGTADSGTSAAQVLRQQQRKSEFVVRQRAARQAVQAAWRAAAPLRGPHPYLAAKGLDMAGCTALRVDGGNLLVPMMWGRHIASIQTITPQGQKRFFAGAAMRGCCLVLNRPRAAVALLCEGLATGLALLQSVVQARVLVCFAAGNLPLVAQRLHAAGQLRGNVLVCADNDHATQARTGRNPGLEKAREAADLIGAGLAMPEGIQGTDWADALQEWEREFAGRNPHASAARCRAAAQSRLQQLVLREGLHVS